MNDGYRVPTVGQMSLLMHSPSMKMHRSPVGHVSESQFRSYSHLRDLEVVGRHKEEEFGKILGATS